MSHRRSEAEAIAVGAAKVVLVLLTAGVAVLLLAEHLKGNFGFSIAMSLACTVVVALASAKDDGTSNDSAGTARERA